MSVARRIVVALTIGCACLAVSSCGLESLTSSFLGSGSGSSSSATATTTPGAIVSKTTTGTHTAMARSPRPAAADPLLKSGKWGYRKTKTVGRHLESGVTWALHEDLLSNPETGKFSELAQEQAEQLIEIFEDSSKIRRLVDSNGGDPDDALYTVQEIQASDAVAIGVPWVYATLRASFPTRDGQKAVQCHVYRVKTAKGLDKRPLVSSTIVGFVDSASSINNPKNVRLR
jgi:hypothetical protein